MFENIALTSKQTMVMFLASQGHCSYLCSSKCAFEIFTDRFRLLNHFVDSWLFVQERRHAEFVSIKRQIIVCMEDLEQMPDTSFEREVVCEEEEAFCLSVENIAALNVLLSQVNTRIHTVSAFVSLKPLITTCVLVMSASPKHLFTSLSD